MDPSSLGLNRLILEVEVVSVPLSHPDHHFTSSSPGDKKVLLRTLLLHYIALLLL